MAIDYSKAKGNALVKKAAAAQGSTMNTEKIYSLDMGKIHENPDNRKIFNMEGIKGLANVIKEDGFTGAIEVYEREDGEYEILSGHRRFAACKEAGMTSIPAVILPKTDEVSRAKKLITSNIHNRELTAMDKARAIEYYIEHVLRPNGTRNIQNEISKVFEISVTQVKYLRRILKYVPELQELLEHDLIPYSGVVAASDLSEDEQKQLAWEYRQLIDKNNGEALGKAQVALICTQMVNNHNIASTPPVLNDGPSEQVTVGREYSKTSVDELPESGVEEESSDDEVKIKTPNIAPVAPKPQNAPQSADYIRREHERVTLHAVDLLKNNLTQGDLTDEFKESIKTELMSLIDAL